MVTPGSDVPDRASRAGALARMAAADSTSRSMFSSLAPALLVAGALDAAQRGLSVALVERHDLASGTSSRSSRLAHGVCVTSSSVSSPSFMKPPHRAWLCCSIGWRRTSVRPVPLTQSPVVVGNARMSDSASPCTTCSVDSGRTAERYHGRRLCQRRSSKALRLASKMTRSLGPFLPRRSD